MIVQYMNIHHADESVESLSNDVSWIFLALATNGHQWCRLQNPARRGRADSIFPHLVVGRAGF